ncbi:hypothetical protein [Streptomyces sp. NPDC049879]|uniref:hypothetical protein n=1 Tax=Streptomyces sp. NPDC049879 TaxID=3365598 RepID=UPI00379F8A7E
MEQVVAVVSMLTAAVAVGVTVWGTRHTSRAATEISRDADDRGQKTALAAEERQNARIAKDRVRAAAMELLDAAGAAQREFRVGRSRWTPAELTGEQRAVVHRVQTAAGQARAAGAPWLARYAGVMDTAVWHMSQSWEGSQSGTVQENPSFAALMTHSADLDEVVLRFVAELEDRFEDETP